MFGSWQSVFRWALLFVLLSIISILIDAYAYHPAPQLIPIKLKPPTQAHVAVHAPSVIANMHNDAKRQFLQGVDLRRAEVRLATQAEYDNTVKPLMDKVLVVPKRFRGV
jgi:hypothetical protein